MSGSKSPQNILDNLSIGFQFHPSWHGCLNRLRRSQARSSSCSTGGSWKCEPNGANGANGATGATGGWIMIRGTWIWPKLGISWSKGFTQFLFLSPRYIFNSSSKGAKLPFRNFSDVHFCWPQQVSSFHFENLKIMANPCLRPAYVLKFPHWQKPCLKPARCVCVCAPVHRSSNVYICLGPLKSTCREWTALPNKRMF